jgi:hypothetical protein
MSSEVKLDKTFLTYGKYYLHEYDEDGRPLYEHHSGFQYLYKQYNQWFILAAINSTFARNSSKAYHKRIDQSIASQEEICPYR